MAAGVQIPRKGSGDFDSDQGRRGRGRDGRFEPAEELWRVAKEAAFPALFEPGAQNIFRKVILLGLENLETQGQSKSGFEEAKTTLAEYVGYLKGHATLEGHSKILTRETVLAVIEEIDSRQILQFHPWPFPPPPRLKFWI